MANDIDSSAFALPCAVPLIQLTSASRPGATSAPRTPSVRVEEGDTFYVGISTGGDKRPRTPSVRVEEGANLFFLVFGIWSGG